MRPRKQRPQRRLLGGRAAVVRAFVGRWILRRRTAAAALALGALSTFLAFVPPVDAVPPIAWWQRLLLRSFGLSIPIAVAVGLLVAARVWGGRLSPPGSPWRQLVGAAMLAIAFTGFVALLPIPPRTVFTDPSLVGPAGAVGSLLVGSLRAGSFLIVGREELWVVGLVVVGLLGIRLLWPAAPGMTFRGACWAAAAIVQFGRRRAWPAACSVVKGSGRLIRAGFLLAKAAAWRRQQLRSVSQAPSTTPIPLLGRPGRAQGRAAPVTPAAGAASGSAPPVPLREGRPAEATARPAVPVRDEQLPPLSLLQEGSRDDGRTIDLDRTQQLLLDTLAQFGVEEARIVAVNQGPTITQFGLEPGWHIKRRLVVERGPDGRAKREADGTVVTHVEEASRTRVKVSQVVSLANDLALALAAPTIRVEAPVPGRPYMGIEVPNATSSLVTLRSVVEGPSFQKIAARSKLAVALGKGVNGEPVAADLAQMPHLLVAGATGAGKSVMLNTLIVSILMQARPNEVRLMMIDPKRVEMSSYDDVPHLLHPVVVDIDKVVGILRWVGQEMDRRYKKFQAAKARNIEAYNRRPLPGDGPLPYYVVIIDELADLMMQAAAEVEVILCRLAQLARATGIHLVVATQRPSVDVITGLIKANFPTRISFAVSSQVDSRTILDMGGAEKLLGRGDMLYMPRDASKPIRLQGAFVSDAEIEAVVSHWKGLRPVQYVENLDEEAQRLAAEEDADDALLEQARKLAETAPLSVSYLQRKLRIGYPRAARLLEILEAEGIGGPVDESGRSRATDGGDTQNG
ncbi:MAG: DNA translocase FtsK [Chloroflexi bacterium]|nr:DNA translocase FtsK [Chloroflexota bacterium]